MSAREMRLVILSLLLLAPFRVVEMAGGEEGGVGPFRFPRRTLLLFHSSARRATTPSPLVALAAHFGTNKGGDLGDVPELPSFRRAGSGDSAVPGIVTQFDAQHGLMAIGMVAELLNELNRAFCDQTLARVYKCADYEDARRRLWQTFGDDYICGFDASQWSSGLRVRDLAIQEQFEYLLSKCDTPWWGRFSLFLLRRDPCCWDAPLSRPALHSVRFGFVVT